MLEFSAPSVGFVEKYEVLYSARQKGNFTRIEQAKAWQKVAETKCSGKTGVLLVVYIGCNMLLSSVSGSTQYRNCFLN
jgi:hypothetical protein